MGLRWHQRALRADLWLVLRFGLRSDRQGARWSRAGLLLLLLLRCGESFQTLSRIDGIDGQRTRTVSVLIGDSQQRMLSFRHQRQPDQVAVRGDGKVEREAKEITGIDGVGKMAGFRQQRLVGRVVCRPR